MQKLHSSEGHFWPILPKFSFHKLLHSRKISEQTNESFLRKTVNRHTGGQTDSADFALGHLYRALHRQVVQKRTLSDRYSPVYEPTTVIKTNSSIFNPSHPVHFRKILWNKNQLKFLFSQKHAFKNFIKHF